MRTKITAAQLLLVLSVLLSKHADARTLFVATDGNDTATGSVTAPFRTISRAAREAMPGDTVLVRSGVYRERVAPPRGGEPGRPITYRAEKWGTVFVKGSDVWRPKWKDYRGTVYFAAPDESLFKDEGYVDEANPFRVALASTPYQRDGRPEAERFGTGDVDLVYTCGQFIVNGSLWTQVPFLKEVEQNPMTWTFVPRENRIYANFGDVDPRDATVEISTRRRIFAPHVRGLGYIHVEGFVFEHCGNNYPTNFWMTPKWAQAGAIGLRGGHHWVVRNNVIRHVNTVAIDAGSGGGNNEPAPMADLRGAKSGSDNLIEDNYLIDNGAAGIVAASSLRLTIRGNVILRNNFLHFRGKKRYEHAGIKCHDMTDGRIEQNYIADNPLNDGVWLDNRFLGARVTRNVIVNNGIKGIFLEMSDYDWDSAFVDHNVVVGNGEIQFYVHDASGSTVMHNVFANSPMESRHGQGAYIYQVTQRTRTYHHSLFNNLFVNHKVMLDINYPSHRSGPQRIDANYYDAAPDARVFVVNSASDRPSPWTADQFARMIHDELGSDSPGIEAFDARGKARLTLKEWRAFWRHHGANNDELSLARKGMRVAFDSQTATLTIDVPFDPTTSRTKPHASVKSDFFGRQLPRDGTARFGPFQDLKQGRNVYKVWHGLPILKKGELPNDAD